MTTFTIDETDNITAYAAPEQVQDGTQVFTTQKEFAKLTAEWPTARLVETWNGFAGTPGFDTLKPVKRFTDRKVAVARIWQAIQKLAPGAEQGAQGAPKTAAATTGGSTATDPPKAKKGAKKAKGAKQHAPAMREGTKKAKVIDMMRRDNGATNEEIRKAAGWLPHTVRGFLSITGRTLKIETMTRENGAKAYHIG